MIKKKSFEIKKEEIKKKEEDFLKEKKENTSHLEEQNLKEKKKEPLLEKINWKKVRRIIYLFSSVFLLAFWLFFQGLAYFEKTFINQSIELIPIVNFQREIKTQKDQTGSFFFKEFYKKEDNLFLKFQVNSKSSENVSSKYKFYYKITLDGDTILDEGFLETGIIELENVISKDFKNVNIFIWEVEAVADVNTKYADFKFEIPKGEILEYVDFNYCISPDSEAQASDCLRYIYRNLINETTVYYLDNDVKELYENNIRSKPNIALQQYKEFFNGDFENYQFEKGKYLQIGIKQEEIDSFMKIKDPFAYYQYNQYKKNRTDLNIYVEKSMLKMIVDLEEKASSKGLNLDEYHVLMEKQTTYENIIYLQEILK